MDVPAPSSTPTPSIEPIFGKAVLAELQSLSKEKDSELRRDGLLSLAGRLEASGREEAALRVYALVPGDEKAAARKAALEGQGSFGAAFEAQLRRLNREVLRPEAILPMAAGSVVYGLTRGALLGRLLANPAAAAWTRGLGARGLAATGAFAAEVPVFAASSRALRSLAGESTVASFGGDLGHSALTLGLFKSFGAAGHWAARSANLPPALVGQAAVFSGLLTAHRLEEEIGLRPAAGRGATLGEVLGSMLSLNLGSRLGQSLLGSRYAQFRRELDFRAATSRPHFWSGPSLSPGLRLAGAGGFSRRSVESAKLESTTAQSRGGSAIAAKKTKPELERLVALIDHEFLPEAWQAFPEFKELKSRFDPRDFRILAAKIGPLFEDSAMNRRAYAFIFLDRLVPGLSPSRRMRQLPRIDRGFQDQWPWVRELAIQAFDRNAAFWPRAELVRRIPELRRLTGDPEQQVREAAYRGLVRMTEFLAPESRFSHLQGLTRHFAETGEVDHFKSLPIDRALRSLKPPERLRIVTEFERTLPRHSPSFWYIPFFGDMISRLEPADHLGRIQALEKLYRHSDLHVQISAMTAVDNNMDRLPRGDWAGRIRRFERMTQSPEPRVRERAVKMLGDLMAAEPRFLDSRIAGRLDLRIVDSAPVVREAALEAQKRIAASLDPQGRSDLLLRLVGRWSWTRSVQSREEIALALREIYLGMGSRERQAWRRDLMESRQQRPLPSGLAAAFAEPGKANGS